MIRRDFFKTAAKGWGSLAALGAVLTPHTAQARTLKLPDQRDTHDEEFWSAVRQQFPLTHDRVYLNTGGLGASPTVSIQALKDKVDELEEISETGHTAELWQTTKERAGLALGCDPGEIAFTRNTTEGANIVCNGLPLQRGDEVITSSHEHVGNTMTWLARQKREGIILKVFDPDTQSARNTLDRIESLITPRTRAISVSHVTCSTGQILPVRQIGQLIADRDIYYFVDGAQAPGMMPVDVHEIGCHAYATSGHKWLLGPKGTGLLYVRRDALDLIDARFVGAYSGTGHFDIRTGEFQFHPTAQRYEYGTVSAPLIAGLGAAFDFSLQIGLDAIWRHNHALAAALKDGLNELGARVLSPQRADEHSSMITFKLDGVGYKTLKPFLTEKFNLRTRGIYEGGLDGVRISLHLYNSLADVGRVLEGVEAAQKL